MKKATNFLSAILLACSFLVSGCDEPEELGPGPSPGFTQDRKFIEVNEMVSFTNTSTNAVRYLWDFGNGKTSTEENPSIIYSELGNYKVKLTAYDKEGLPRWRIENITVGYRVFMGVTIRSLNFTNPAGGTWDVGNGPDLKLSVGEAAAPNWSSIYHLENNVTQAMLPKEYVFNIVSRFTDQDWKFQLADVDETSEEVMVEWIGNPQTATKDNQTGKGTLTLTNGPNVIDVHYQVY